MSEPPMLRRLRGTARTCLVAMLVVVAASAFLRHHGASVALQVVWAPELAVARLLHRVAATLVLLGAMAMVVWAWPLRRAAPAGSGPFVPAAALLGVALLLSAVGLAGGASRAEPVVLLNLLGGLTMLALCARLSRDPARAGFGRAAWVVSGLVLLQAGAGALAATQASADCAAFLGCTPAAWAHRLAGVLLAFGLAMFGLWAAWRQGRRAGGVLALLGVLLLLLGALAAVLGSAAPPGLVVLHNAAGALALALLVREA
jgi:hypothetical protein